MRIDGGEPEGYVDTPDTLDCRASTVLLVKSMGDELEKRYPGWLWAIQPDERGGIITIRALRLSGEWGYIFKTADIQGDPKVAMPKVMRAGGEILERFGVRRGIYRYNDWRRLPRDFRGLPIPDISDKAAKQQRRVRDEALTRALATGAVQLRVEDKPGRRELYLKPGA